MPFKPLAITSVQRNDLSSFSPLHLGGCVMWLRADQGVSQSGNVLSSWQDYGPNRYLLNAKSTTSFAGYNANGGPRGTMPAVTFSGAQSIGNGSITPITGTIERTPCTAFLVQLTTSSQTTYRVYSGTYAMLSQGTTRSWRAPSIGQDVNVTGMSLTNWECWVGVTAADGTSFMRVNGTQVASIATSAGAAATANFWVGAASNGAAPWTGGNLWEVIWYDRVLSTAEILLVETYIRTLTGIF